MCADVTGPIASLPGSSHCTPEGTMCDNHPDRPATVRMQGETDSFGSEMHDLCAECTEKAREEPHYIGTCDWCSASEVVLNPRRDYEEGMAGRVYYVCQPCITRSNARIAAEFDDDDNGYDDGPDYDYEDEWDEPPDDLPEKEG